MFFLCRVIKHCFIANCSVKKAHAATIHNANKATIRLLCMLISEGSTYVSECDNGIQKFKSIINNNVFSETQLFLAFGFRLCF